MTKFDKKFGWFTFVCHNLFLSGSTLMILTLSVLLFVSCEKSNGIMVGADTNKKLETETEYHSNGEYAFTLGMKYVWSGKFITDLIMLADELSNESIVNDYGGRFNYEGDVLTEITTPYGPLLTCSYVSGLLSEITIQDEYYIFSYTNGKVTKIVSNYNGDPNNVWDVVWEGDNVVSMHIYGNGYDKNASYTYDNKKNAHGALPLWLIIFDYYDPVELLSKNNVKTKQWTSISNSSTLTSTITYSYSYKGNWPINREGIGEEYFDGERRVINIVNNYEYTDGTGKR